MCGEQYNLTGSVHLRMLQPVSKKLFCQLEVMCGSTNYVVSDEFQSDLCSRFLIKDTGRNYCVSVWKIARKKKECFET